MMGQLILIMSVIGNRCCEIPLPATVIIASLTPLRVIRSCRRVVLFTDRLFSVTPVLFRYARIVHRPFVLRYARIVQVRPYCSATVCSQVRPYCSGTPVLFTDRLFSGTPVLFRYARIVQRPFVIRYARIVQVRPYCSPTVCSQVRPYHLGARLRPLRSHSALALLLQQRRQPRHLQPDEW